MADDNPVNKQFLEVSLRRQALVAASISVIGVLLPIVIVLSSSDLPGDWREFPSNFKHYLVMLCAAYLVIGMILLAVYYWRDVKIPVWLIYAAAPALALLLLGLLLIFGNPYRTGAPPQFGIRVELATLLMMLFLIAVQLTVLAILLSADLSPPNTLAKTALINLAVSALLWPAATLLRGRPHQLLGKHHAPSDLAHSLIITRSLAHTSFLAGALTFLVFLATLTAG